MLRSADRPQESIDGPVTDLHAVLEAAVDGVAEVEPDENPGQPVLRCRSRLSGDSPISEIDGTGTLPSDGEFDGTGEWIPLGPSVVCA